MIKSECSLPTKTTLTTLLLLFSIVFQVRAQRQATTFFGIGHTNQYDTYLSPLAYKGVEMDIMHATQRPMHRTEKVTFLTRTQLEYGYARNHTKTAHDVACALDYTMGWLRNWCDLTPGLVLMAGGTMETHAGVLYNTRNGNNPAQAKVYLNVAASGAASYRTHLHKQVIDFRYQLEFPLFGTMFSPQYGQSYYNIFSQRNYDHNIVFTHPGNALSLRQMFTVNFVFRRQALAIGYLSNLKQSTPHHLRQHQYSRSLLIGWSRTL